MSMTAENMKNIGMTAQLLEQAAKEVGEAYSNKQKLEHSGPNGEPIQHNHTVSAEDLTDEQLAAIIAGK